MMKSVFVLLVCVSIVCAQQYGGQNEQNHGQDGLNQGGGSGFHQPHQGGNGGQGYGNQGNGRQPSGAGRNGPPIQGY